MKEFFILLQIVDTFINKKAHKAIFIISRFMIIEQQYKQWKSGLYLLTLQ